MEERTTISVAVRRSDKPDSKLKAFADVTLSLGAPGTVTISGFSVFDDGSGAARVAAPARKGSSRYFDIVTMHGDIRRRVEDAILADYKAQIEE